MTSHSQKPIRVLVVDDSAFMRQAIARMLNEPAREFVVETARNGKDALKKVADFKPDVMTLDIEMPGMNGLTVLECIMRQMPTPVIVVSSFSEDGAEVTVRALELGAVDFLPKQISESPLHISSIRDQLLAKVRVAAGATGKVGLPTRPSPGDNGRLLQTFPSISVKKMPSSPRINGATGEDPPSDMLLSGWKDGEAAGKSARRVPVPTRHTGMGLPPLLLIGSSTGGPQALQEVLSGLSPSLSAGVVVAQHMPKVFTKPFAERMNRVCPLEVVEAKEGDLIRPGVVLIAPGGRHMTLERLGTGPAMCHISDEPSELPYRPSVDLLMQSAAKLFGGKVLGVVLTGMGNDGLEGARAIRAVQGRVWAQDEASCIVYGMPKAVIEGQCADKILPLSRMAREVNGFLSGNAKGSEVKSGRN